MSQNLTEGEFVGMLRAELSSMMIKNAVQGAAAAVSDSEVRDLYQQKHEQRVAKLLILPHKTVKGIEKPTDDVLKPFYQAGQEKYAVPETRAFTLAVLKQEAAKKSFSVSEEELKQYYDSHIDEFSIREKRTLQQAVFPSQADADSAYDTVTNGKNLKDVAKNSYAGRNLTKRKDC
jgi:peptidyl-prolyl cis-trans isomerase D